MIIPAKKKKKKAQLFFFFFSPKCILICYTRRKTLARPKRHRIQVRMAQGRERGSEGELKCVEIFRLIKTVCGVMVETGPVGKSWGRK